MYLFKNATVYAPAKKGILDVLVVAGRIIALGRDLAPNLPGLDIVDAKGLILTPGLIDQHIHVIGGGGEGGPVSRVPEVQFSSLVACGSTTVVGVAGTDSVTRSIPAVLAKVRALAIEGISTWMYTSNYALPPSLLTSSIRDDLFMVPEVVGVKLAHSDHRSSFPSHQEMLRILSDIRVGGMIAGKPGVLHIHMGELPGGFEEIDALLAEGVPAKHIRPTHIARKEWQFEQALAFTRKGGVIDVTSGGGCFAEPHEVIALALRENADPGRITMSTDGNGSIPRFNKDGAMIGLGMGSPASNLDQLRLMVHKSNIPLETALPLITSNVARHLELPRKGEIAEGFDADFCLFSEGLDLIHVMAKGRFLMRNKNVVVKGMFEA